MQRVLSWEEGISEYQAVFSNIRIEPPPRCKSCGCTKFHKWGTYRRYVIEEKRDYQISIRRFRCVKCRQTYSYLPSFCLSRLSYSSDLVMKLISALILKIRYELVEMRRQAYIFLKRFVSLENTWLSYLRPKGFGYIPSEKGERRTKILTALLDKYTDKEFSAKFLEETGRHFMSEK